MLGLDEQRALLALDEGEVTLPLEALSPRWNGDFLLFWRPAPGDRVLLGPDSPPHTLGWLRRTLAGLSGAPQGLAGGQGYDAELRAAVETFQRAMDLQDDGIVGPETLIRLNSAAGLPDIPHLQDDF